MSQSLNADFSQRACMDTRTMSWQASPSPTVWRKRLDLVAGEFSRVTAVVRYDADSSFHAHDHPEGEEILVLEGTFSDEHGGYSAGTYLLNPPGFRHAPFSREGCIIFVKLRQFAGSEREHVVIDTRSAPWASTDRAGMQRLHLYARPAYPESIALVRYAPGTSRARTRYPGGWEVFVLEGEFEDEDGRYGPGTWLRLPPGASNGVRSPHGCLLYEKRGHLGEQPRG